MTHHKDRVALVTGAAGGLGQAIARRLSRDGARLVLADLLDCRETASTMAAAPVVVRADIATEEGWHAIAAAARPLGGVDIVVNNAAIYPFARLDRLDAALWHKVIATNLDAVFYSVKQFVAGMRDNDWGRFINVASNAIGTSQPELAHYMASKMGAIGLARGIANDFGDRNVTANVVLPSLTRTPGTAAVPDAMFDMVVQTQSIKRRAEPDDVAGLVSFLASDDAGFITGQAICADGGLLKLT